MDHHHRHRDNTPEHGSNPNSRTKPRQKNLGTPGDNESYNKKTTEGSAGEAFPDENPEAYESNGSNDARRKGELNHAIFVKLQEISQYNIEIGNYDEGLANYDRCIDHLLRTLPQGPSASMFKDFLIKTVKYLNEVSLRLLQEEKVKDSLLLLERCRKMTHPNSFGPYPTLRSLTYNHLGCCYRRIGKLDKAVYYLEKAWEFIQEIERVETSGITHINLCAVLSQLGDHKRALEHATMAVSDCSFDLIEATKKNAEGDPKVHVHKQATMLAIAYHNLATEEEACRNGEAALQAYLRAYNLVREYNPPQHELCVKFGRAYEEARARISKPGFNKRANSPSEAMRRYGNSPQNARVVVKRPTSFNTANKAAKAYLQNNRVVIPKRTGTAQQPRPLLSSPQNAQLTQKLFVPSASQRKIERPVTAHPQSRTQHYQVSGLNETPRNQKETHHKHDDEEDEDAPNRPSEANSEIERLGLDDEDLEKADLKSNRLAFLQSLNQYNMDKSTKGGVAPQRNNFMGGTPDNKTAVAQQQEQGHQEKRARIQSAKPQGRAQAKPKVDQAKINHATVKLQAFCRGYLARQEVSKVLAETPQQVYLVLIAETVKGNLENGPLSKETLYFFLMIYELDSQLIHIHIKNLENRKFHRALVEYQVANRTSKAAIINELREACERLIQHLEIHNDQIVFRDDVTDRGEKPEDLYMMGQELARREAENAITQITERTEEKTDESEVRPMGSRKEDEEFNSETGHKKYGQSHSHSHSGDNIMEEKIEEENLVDDIAEEDDKYEEEAFDAEEPEDKKKQQKSKPKHKVEEDIEDDIQEENDKPGQPIVDTNDIANLVGLSLFGGRKQEEMDKAAQTIQKHVRGKLEKDKYQIFKEKDFKVVFSKAQTIDKNVIGFRLVQRPDEEDKDVVTYDLCCYNFTTGKQFSKIDYPIKKRKVEGLTLTKLLTKVDVDVPHNKVTLKKKEIKDKKPRKENKKEEEEELPDLEDKDVQNATLAIQKAYKNKKNKQEQKPVVKEEPKPQVKEEPKKKEEEEELPDLEDKDVQNATLAIQKAYKKKKDKQEQKEKQVIKEEPKLQVKEEQKKKEEEEELPDLEDKDVQNATLAIQKAYKKKKDKQEQQQKPVIKEEPKPQVKEEPKKKEEEEELPDLEDKDVQNATLAIQKAYKKKKDKQEQKEKQVKEETKLPVKEEPKKKKEEDEELPDLEDKDVQNATLAIQKAYKKKKDKKEAKKPVEEEHEHEQVSRRDSVRLYGDKTREEVKKAAQTIQKHIRGKLARDKYEIAKDKKSKLVFSKCARVQTHLITFKLVERGQDPDSLLVCCHNITTGKKFETTEIPRKLVNLNTLQATELVEKLDIDVFAPTVALKGKFKVKEKSPDYEEEEWDAEPVEEEEKPISKSEAGPEFLASVPLYFGKEKLDSTIHYDKKKDQILVKHGFEHGKEAKSLDIPVKDLEIGAEFSKDYFISNMDIVLLSKLNYKSGRLTYETSPMHIPVTKVDVKSEKKLATPNKRYNQDFDEKDLTSQREDEDKKEGNSALQDSYRSGNFEVNQEAEELTGKKGGQIRTQSIDAVGEVGQYRSGNVFAPGQVKMGKRTGEEDKKQKQTFDDELPNLEDKDVQNATLTIQKAYKNKKDKQNKPVVKEEPKHQQKHKKEEEEEELPNLEDKDVQNATLAIQKAYKNKKNKQAKAVVQEEPKHQHKHEYKKEEEEELPNLEDKDVQNATLAIQKAYKKKKNKQPKAVIQEEPKQQHKHEHEHKHKKEEEEELPNLEDKDVQNATLTIQKAYKNKKNKQPKAVVQEEPKPQHKHKREEEEELPNLEDKDVQNATLTIQKAYKNKKNKQPKAVVQEEPQHHHKHKKEEEEELPNLEDKDVQNATLTIQKAYKNKKNKQPKAVVQEEPKPQHKHEPKKEEEEELPDLEDKDVQNATLTIQKAYKNKKNKQPKAVVQEEPKQQHKHEHKKEEEEELPNLEDKDVQNATLTIQKAYKNKKNKQNKAVVQEEPQHQHKHEHKHKKEEEEELPDLQDKDVQNATLTIQKAYKNKKNKQPKVVVQEEPQHQPKHEHKHKKEEEEELPNLEDKDVQNATLTIQKAYKNKKNKQPKAVVQEEPQHQHKHEHKKEEEEELPDLEDKDVQNATLTIQKAYKNKKNKQPKTVVQEEPKPQHKHEPKKEEEEELPDLEDKDVQNATLAIQKAYKNKKNKQNKPVKEEPVVQEPVKQKPQEKEKEEEELPNLEDPEVQNATLAIQKAYLKKKNKPAAAPEKKPSPKKETIPQKKDDSGDDYDYEPDFSEPKSSPAGKTKPRPQPAGHKKDKSDTFELVNVTQDQKPEDVEKLLKEVNEEFDVFNKREKSDDDNVPYDEEDSAVQKKKSPPKKSPPKKKGNDDDEDFEPIEDDF